MKLLAIDPRNDFGTINPPPEIQPFITKGGNGVGGISLFLNNFIQLIYILASVVFVIMIVWGGVEWVLSGGDKEKISGAQKRITNAIIGITILATAFAIIKVVGTFTGFTFFESTPKCAPGTVYNTVTNTCAFPPTGT